MTPSYLARFDDASAEAVIERFQKEKVDAVIVINCNFGNEEIVADIAKALGKPVCLWAPLDDEYYVDGMRPTDSQCGLFGLSRQMQRFHIPFSHLPCCEVDSDEFKEGFESFVRVACMVKNFTGMRIGQIGGRPSPFFSVIWNEGELMEKFGVRIIPINFAVIEQRMKSAPELYAEEIAEYEEDFTERQKENWIERVENEKTYWENLKQEIEDYYDKETKQKEMTEIHVAKHRNGPVGSFKLRFLKEFGRFVEREK